MIYTVTFNPSLDYIVGTEGFQLGNTNRGFTGEEIRRRVDGLGLRSEFIDVGNGFSRINVKMKEFDGTEINGQGPVIGEDAVRRLMERLDSLEEGDTLVLAGSIPASMPDSIYSDILARLEGKGVVSIVDATKDLLLNVLKYRPFLIKPNHHELGEIFGVELEKREDVIPYAEKLQEQGAQNVLVSMGGKGAVLLDAEGSVHMLPVPKGTLVNAVGSGDSMVAGFLAGWTEKKDYEHAFRMGISAGSASAFSELLATKEEILGLYETLQ